MKKVKDNLHFIILGLVLLFAFAVLALGGSDSAVLSGKGVLNVFLPEYSALRNEGEFFAWDTTLNVAGSSGRDLFYSEYKFTSFLFMLLPVYPAYVALYLLKIVIGSTGMAAFGKAVLKEEYENYKSLVWIAGIAYSLFNVFPAYWMSFASLPWLFLLLYKARYERNAKYLIAFLLYPFFSDMLHFGLIIVPAILIYFVFAWIKDKKFPLIVLLGDILLAAGYMLTEYRYSLLVYDGSINLIYEVDEWSEFSFDKLINTLRLLFWDYEYMPKMAAYLVVPVTVVIILVLVLLKNKLVKAGWIAEILAILAVAAVLFSNTEYNDLLHTITADADSITYDEYYDANIYSMMKEDIGYMDQWMISYGLNEGALAYSGIKTIDGRIDVPLFKSEAYYQKILKKALGDYEPDESNTVVADFDINSLKEYGTRYVCSAAEISNANEQGLTLVNSYSDENDKVYLYITSSRFCEADLKDVPFEERQNLTYDLNDFYAIVDKIDALCEEANKYKEAHPDMSDEEIIAALNGEEMRECYYELLEFDDLICTVYYISNINKSSDAGNQEVYDRNEEIYSDVLVAGDKMSAEIRDICKSPYNVIIADEMSEYFVEAMLDYEDMTEEEQQRIEKVNSLENEYYLAMSEDYIYEYNGEEWTFERLDEEMDELSREDYLTIYNGIFMECAKATGEIYLELIQLNNETAVEEGYDNYAEYAYEVSYGRDFTVDDAKKLFKEVKKDAVPYDKLLKREVNNLSSDGSEDILGDDLDTYEKLYPYFNALDPEIGNTLEHMLKNNLYDLEESDSKSDEGYTTPLTYYGDAFIFDCPSGNVVKDLGTYVHEFGHYVNMAHDLANTYENTNYMDVSEICSQGMEALICTNYKEIYGEKIGEYLEKSEMLDVISAVPDACMVAEFEIYAYEHPDSTVEELSRKYAELSYEYGSNYGLEELYFWINIAHLYQVPMYYISYATSALSAVEIYNMYKENPELAKEKYLEIEALGSGWKFRSINEFAGLDDIFKKGTIKKIYRELYTSWK